MEDWTENDWTEWITRMYEAVDAKQVDGVVAQFTPGGTLRFGNGDPVVGRVAIRDALAEFFAAIGALSHAFTNQWREGDTLLLEAELTITRLDGTTVVLPAAVVYELSEGLAERGQIYTDISPVFPQGELPALCRGGAVVV